MNGESADQGNRSGQPEEEPVEQSPQNEVPAQGPAADDQPEQGLGTPGPGASTAEAVAPPTGGPEAPPQEATGALQRLQTGLGRVAEQTEALPSLAEGVAKILQILEDRGKLDRAREMAIQKMHEELTSYRQKGVDHAKKRVLLNLIGFYDNLEQCLEQLGGEENREASESVDWLREMLLETLYREDVEPMEEGDGTLDRDRHKVVRAVPVDEPKQNETVLEVVKKGFLWHGDVLRREHVVVRRYVSPGEAPAAANRAAAEAPPAGDAESQGKEAAGGDADAENTG